MSVELGILFALAALIFWGFGDFLIQRSTRKFGDWETLFIITTFGAVILTPFVYNDPQFALLFDDKTFLMFIGISVVLLIAAILDFEALKKGKIAVVEPIYALEVPISAILALMIINESIEFLQIIVLSILVIGLIMISLKSHHFSRRAWVEKGVVLAVIATIFMGSVNFLIGFASRITNPLLANWFVDVFLAVISLFYIMSNKRFSKLLSDFKGNKQLILAVSTFDNLAWIAFAIATTFIPIVIALGFSESYIALAALLGFLINKERLMKHQKIGLVIVLLSASALALII